jgi:uncharacterized protein Usg
MGMIIQPIDLVTVRVDYFLPDYPSLIEEFCWQTKDTWPDIPRVHRFLNYWYENIDAVINSVMVTHCIEREWSYRRMIDNERLF